MKRTTLSMIGLSLLSLSTLFGQAPQRAQNLQNSREGESVEYCHQHVKHAEMMTDPAFAAQFAADQELMRLVEQQMKENPPVRGTIYKIPVVFHVLHNGGIENISREQILNAVDILNRDYRKLNADTATVTFAFNSSNPAAVATPTDIEVEFVLATKAPNGDCFNGITRTLSAMSYQGDNGSAQVNAIVAGNDVYNGQWAGNKYLNFFVCGEIGGAAGYTNLPSSWGATSMTNGIWILHNYTGAIGTSSVNTSRALTHEVGHWLNLSHVWGGNNDPGSAGCDGTDGVQDTPNTVGSTACNLNANTCSNDNAFWGFDQKDNVENYMDYSYCSKMFTPGQAARMRAAIVVTNTGRANLWSPSNLAATGAEGSPVLCQAQFTVPKTAICAGESLQFSDASFNAVSGWSWTFAGGTPATSSSQNPLVTYTTPGVYTVTLTATDGSSSVTETKTSYITVYPTGEGLPYHEGFENLTTFVGSDRWMINNQGNNNTWEVTTTAANSGTKSTKLGNFGQPIDNVDELISAPVDLSGITSTTGATLTFRYAYRKRSSANDDYLKVFLTNSCGDTWDQRKTMHGSTLSNVTATTAWTPTAADWVTVHMTNVTSSYWVSNFRFKFRFEADGGNNIYLDDINIYSGEPSETIVLGVNDAPQLANAAVYPNPADEEVNVRFSAPAAQTVTVTVTDLLGHSVQQHVIYASEGNNLVTMSTDDLAPGMYLIQLNEGNAIQTLQFVIK